jgi:CheY-like chemotaxis protein
VNSPAAEAVPLARDLRPDVIVMEVEMPGASGIEATKKLRAAAPRSAVVVFNLRDDAATQEQARAASAAAFMAKHRTEATHDGGLEDEVDRDFRRARRKSLFGRIGARLREDVASEGLLCFEELREVPRTKGWRICRGARTVPVAQYMGQRRPAFRFRWKLHAH